MPPIMEIPLPFTKVCLIIGEPLKVPAALRPGQMRDWADNLAKTIAKLDKKAENMVQMNGAQKEYLGNFDR